MAIRTVDIFAGRRRPFARTGALARLVSKIEDRHASRLALRRMMEEQAAGRASGARI